MESDEVIIQVVGVLLPQMPYTITGQRITASMSVLIMKRWASKHNRFRNAASLFQSCVSSQLFCFAPRLPSGLIFSMPHSFLPPLPKITTSTSVQLSFTVAYKCDSCGRELQVGSGDLPFRIGTIPCRDEDDEGDAYAEAKMVSTCDGKLVPKSYWSHTRIERRIK